MKILMYSVRPDEKADIANWRLQNQFTIDTTEDVLNSETVRLSEGYDAIVIQQPNSIQDSDIYQKLHKFGVKHLATRSTGYENINLNQAKLNHITVTNVPAYSPRSVSELVLSDVLYLLRNIGEVKAKVANGNFTWEGLKAKEVHSLTVGVIGAGKIGSAVARIFRALGSNVIAYDPVKRPELLDTLEYVELDDLLRESDVVTCHTPLTDETYHMINANSLSSMKNSALLINASRGQVVVTKDLVDALNNHRIAGAAIDTFENEDQILKKNFKNGSIPNDSLNELLKMPNVNVTPHIGFFTDNAVKNMIDISLTDVSLVLSGKKPINEL